MAVELPEGFQFEATQPANAPTQVPEGFGFEDEQSPQEQEKTGFIRGLLQNIGQGVSLGFSDEITAALTAVPAALSTGTSVSEAFTSILDAERLGQEQFAEEQPKTAFAAQLTGGLLTGGVGASKIAGAKIFQGGKTALRRTGKKLSAQAASAAPVGAVFGAGTSEGGLQERAKGAVKGAAIGAVAAPVLAPVIGAATRGLRGVANLFKSRETKDFNASTQQIARAVSRDDDTPQALIRRAEQLGPEANLADLGGANLKRELERAASAPGRAPEMIEKSLVNRLARQGTRVQQVFDRFIGRNTQDAVKTLETISADAAERAAPKYAEAYAKTVNNSDVRLSSLLANPRIQKAIPKAIDRIKSKSSDDDDLLRFLQDDLDPNNPNMILWDHVKRQLDDDASVAFRSGANDLGKDISKNAKTLRAALDQQSPAYAEARSIWTGSKRAEEAFKDGLDFLKGLKNPLTGASAKAAKFDELSTSEQDLFRKGVSMAVRQVIRGADETVEGIAPASLLKQISGSREKRSILNKVIPTQEGRAELFKLLRSEQAFRKTTNDVLRNSRTALRKQLVEEESAKLTEKLNSGVNAVFALRGNFFAFTRAISDVVKGRPATEGVNTAVAKRLLARGEQNIIDALQDVEKFLVLPSSSTSAIARFRQVPSGQKMQFLLSNPQIKKEIDRTLAALVAGLSASGVKADNESVDVTEQLNLGNQ